MTGNAYMKQQETRPQTLGYGLADSPVALLTWVYDKLHLWTDGYPWSDDEVLTWVSIYQFSTAGPAASLRIYYEGGKAEGRESALTTDAISSYLPAEVKLAVAHFKAEVVKLPFFWCRAIGNVVRTRDFEVGGHFAAWEVPQLLAEDVRAFFGKDGEAYGVVPGHDGYSWSRIA